MYRILMAGVFLLVFSATGVFAETIYLKDGKVVRGKIVKEDESAVMVELGDSWQRIERSTIELIKQDEATPVPPAVQTAPTASGSDKPAAQASAPASAPQDGSGFYLGFWLSNNRVEGDFDGTNMPKVDSGGGSGFIIGYSFNRQLGMEIDWGGSTHDAEGSEITVGELSLNLKYSFLPKQTARPFLVGGIGAFVLGDDSLTFGGTGYNLGAGVDFWVGEKATLGLAVIRKIITYDEIVKSDTPLVLVGDINGDMTSIRFDFTYHF